MKKLLFMIAVILISTASFAQGNINKGNFMVGGQAGFDSKKYSDGDEKLSTITISPNFGYFFMNQFAGGIRLSFLSQKYSEDEDASSQFEVAPFLRYYFLPSTNKTNVFLDGSYGFGSFNEGGESSSYNSFAFMAGPAIFLTPSAALEFGIGYMSQGGDAIDYGEGRLNTFGFKIGFQVHLGGSR